MTEWIRYLLLMWGLQYLLTQSTIFGPIRIFWGHQSQWRTMLVYCPPCVGFWFGVLAGHFGYWPPIEWGWRAALESGIASAALGMILGTWFGADEVLEVELPLLEITADE